MHREKTLHVEWLIHKRRWSVGDNTQAQTHGEHHQWRINTHTRLPRGEGGQRAYAQKAAKEEKKCNSQKTSNKGGGRRQNTQNCSAFTMTPLTLPQMPGEMPSGAIGWGTLLETVLSLLWSINLSCNNPSYPARTFARECVSRIDHNMIPLGGA